MADLLTPVRYRDCRPPSSTHSGISAKIRGRKTCSVFLPHRGASFGTHRFMFHSIPSMPSIFLPHRGGGAEPPGPREARPEDKLREAEGGVARAPRADSPLRFAPLRSANHLPHVGGGKASTQRTCHLILAPKRVPAGPMRSSFTGTADGPSGARLFVRVRRALPGLWRWFPRTRRKAWPDRSPECSGRMKSSG